MLFVPFENLDIVPLHTPIRLDEQALYDKIVRRRRGGFCYELNGMFAWLLRQVGYRVTYLNARVAGRDGRIGPDFDHLALLVQPPLGGGHWLADVGFGDSFLVPLGLGSRSPQDGGDGHLYWLDEVEGGLLLSRRRDGEIRNRLAS